MNREKELLEEQAEQASPIEPDLPIDSHTAESEHPTEIPAYSPSLDEGDVEHADEFNHEYTGRYQIRETENTVDLYAGEKQLGSVIAEEDRDAYSSAVEEAYIYGRSVWISRSEDTVYANVIIRTNDAEYEMLTYARAIPVEQEKEEPVIEELPVEESNHQPEFLGELPAEYLSIVSPTEQVQMRTELNTPRFFTPKELYEYATEVYASTEQSKLELSPTEDSDVAVSVENDGMANVSSGEPVVPVLKSLETPAFVDESSAERSPDSAQEPEQETIRTPSIDSAVLIENPVADSITSTGLGAIETVPAEPIPEPSRSADTDALIKKDIISSIFEKNEAVISPVANVTETIRLIVPEETGAIQEIHAFEDNEPKQEFDTLAVQAVHESQNSAPVAEKIVQKQPESIESFDDGIATASYEARILTAESVHAVEPAATGTEVAVEITVVQHIESQAQDTVEVSPTVPDAPEAGPRRSLEESTGIRLVEAGRNEPTPIFAVETLSIEEQVASEPIVLSRSEQIATDTGISIVSTIEQFHPAQELQPVSSSGASNQTIGSLADDAAGRIADAPEPIAIAA